MKLHGLWRDGIGRRPVLPSVVASIYVYSLDVPPSCDRWSSTRRLSSLVRQHLLAVRT